MPETFQSEIKGVVMHAISENDEWTSDIVSKVQVIVKKALTEERIAIVSLIEQERLERCEVFDAEDIDYLIRRIQDRKLDFRGVQI